ncbi:hypothetical protein [Kitasatospora sp. GP30]|uniref:hypothetical protein n=1 Tax=Kitasatospora sp. GP30 TaxID=3035084 RepID=UPI00118140F3|nr:hypothetical protein [Kitasatospora sp. GP30]
MALSTDSRERLQQRVLDRTHLNTGNQGHQVLSGIGPGRAWRVRGLQCLFQAGGPSASRRGDPLRVGRHEQRDQ